MTSQSETKITNLEKWINHLHLTWKRRASKIPFFVDDWNEAISNGVPPSPVTVWECYFEAGLCFLNGVFAASLMASSASVEAGINLDSRMQDFRQRGKPNLTIDVLKEAKKRGLPIDKLLIQGDDLEENVQFIDNRNKFDHGDFYLPTNTMSAGPLLVKLKKSDRKIIPKWYSASHNTQRPYLRFSFSWLIVFSQSCTATGNLQRELTTDDLPEPASI